MDTHTLLFSAARVWPDLLDTSLLGAFFLAALGAPLTGYVLMTLDYRKYLRSLRRALVVVGLYRRGQPEWVLRASPPCMRALGLPARATRTEVLTAYRNLVKKIHPDLGGSQREFLRLQKHLEEALELTSDGP